MARIKIKVNVAVLQQKTKSINIIIGSGTTAFNVVCKVIEKCSVRESAARFQLWAVLPVRGQAHTEQLLEETDKLADIIPKGNTNSVQFHLKYKPEPSPLTGIVRVYYQIEDELETFQSLIVSPSMKTGDVIQLALARVTLDQSVEGTGSQFELIQRTSNNERVVADHENPLKLASTASQLILRKSSPSEPRPFDEPDKPPPLAETSNRNFSTDSEPITVISSASSHSQSPITEAALEKGKVQLHTDLIEALHRLSSQLESGAPVSTSGKERVLEQAVVEQSEILDTMQALIASLETENSTFREKIDRQSRTILELASWEAKARKAERQVTELMSKQGSKSLTEYKKALAERDRQISELKAQSVVSVNTRLIAVQAGLEKERLRVIELEEALSKKRNELLKLRDELSVKQSIVIDKETEVQYLRHEMKGVKKIETQQKELILKQRTVLQEKDSQLVSLNKALVDEKKLCAKLRKKRLQLDSSTSIARIGDSGHMADDLLPPSSCLFDQVIDRHITAVEITKEDPATDIGFSYAKMDLPVSSKVPCLIVKAVKQGSISAGLIKPGDEILEINGISCRGPHQTKATNLLKTSLGTVKIVVARDSDVITGSPVFHSTPARPSDSTLWATALSGRTDYQTLTTTELPLLEIEGEKYQAIPTPSYTLATNQGSLSQSSNEDVSQDSTAYKSLQVEFSELKEQLDKSEHTCLELESEIDDFQSEMESVKMESGLVEAENQELRQQVSSYEEEVTQIQSNISELQSYLVNLQGQVTDEQQRTASYENQNKLLTRELEEVKQRYEVAQSEANTLQVQVDELKEFVNEKESREQEETQSLKLSNEQLQANLSLREAKITELSALLAKHTADHEHALTSLQDGKLSMETSFTELQDKLTALKLEHSKALTQLKSAKSLLVESERNESELKLKIRYLEQAASEANKQLTESDNKRKAVEGELGGYKVDLETLNLNYKSVSLGLKHTQSKLEAKEQMLTRLQTEVDDSRRNSSKLNNELSQLKTDNKQLQSSLKSSELEATRLEEKLRVSNSEKDSLFQDLESSIDECTQLQVQLREAKSQTMETEQLKKEEPALQAQIQQLETTSKQTSSELENCKKKIEILKQQNSASKEECKKLEALMEGVAKELGDVRAQLDSVTVAKESLQVQAVELQSTVDTLRSELKIKEEVISELKTNRVQIEGDLETESEKHKQATAELSSVKQQLTAHELIKKRNEDMIASMEFMLKQEQAKMEDTQSGLMTKEKEVSVLREQLEGKTNDLLTTQSEIETLKAKLEATSTQLTNCEQIKQAQVAALMEEKGSLGNELERLKEKLASTEAEAVKCRSQVTQLQATVEHSNKERYNTQKSLDQSVKDIKEKERASKELEGQISRLKSDLTQLGASSDSLSSENADLKKLVRQYEREVDKLSAQVQAAEINFEVASRSLDREKAEFTEYKDAAVFIQNELKDTQTKLEESLAKTQRLTLELHAGSEERGKMKISLELKQKESSQLQESLVEAQSSAAKLKSRVSDLQDERDQLLHSVEQLEQSQKEIQSSIETSERKHTSNLKAEREATSRANKELADLKETETAHLEQIQRLERSLEEERSNVQQIMAAQNALKNSLNKLGDEKEVEILRLNKELAERNVRIEQSQEDISKLQTREAALKAEVSEKTQVITSKDQDIESLTIENKQLATEVDVLKSTQEKVAELHSKVTELEGSLGDKTSHLEETRARLGTTEKELTEAKSTIEEQTSSISELVGLKLELVESNSELETTKRKLTDESKACQELKKEREHLLDTLRKLEVEKHTERIQPPTPKLPPAEEMDQAKVRSLLQEKEEEAHRLREYVGKLLSNVVEKAPFLLENFT